MSKLLDISWLVLLGCVFSGHIMDGSESKDVDMDTIDDSILWIDTTDNGTQYEHQFCKDNYKETQYEYQWDNEQLEVINNHYIFHYESCLALQAYKNQGPEGINWPKKPKGTLLIKPSNVKSKLLGKPLHDYLVKSKVNQEPTAMCPKVEDFNGTDLNQILSHLKSGYDIWKNNNARTLAASIDYGAWLQKGFKLYNREKLAGKKSITWEEWLEKNVGIVKSYAGKLRTIADLLKDYPVFRQLGLSFSEIYERRKEIKDMLEYEDIAAKWK